MTNSLLISILLLSAFVSITINGFLRRLSKRFSILIDLPDKSRKFHKRPTPLTGGIGIILGLLISAKIYLDLNNLNDFIPLFSLVMVMVACLVLLFFIFDDLLQIRYLYRLLFQIFSCSLVIYFTGEYIQNFGNLFGFGDLNVGIFGIPLTIFCVVGVMNAFNMIDGINGLCAGCALTMLIFTGFASGFIYDSLLIILIGSLVGFLLFNLRILGKERAVFLGDSGSNVLGFIVAWVAIFCSQNTYYEINPITIVWFIAIPFLDCIGLIISRTKRGISWAEPGRDHIHHKLMENFSPEFSLILIISFTSFISLFAIYLEKNFIESVSFYMFGIFALSYYLLFYFIIKPKIGAKNSV